MKVKCIKNDSGSSLTIGKTYDTIHEQAAGRAIRYYYLINDNGREEWFVKYWFKPISEIRNETIDKLLSDEVTYIKRNLIN